MQMKLRRPTKGPVHQRVRRGNAEDADRMRQELMRAAVELVEEQGPSGVSMRKVAERVGVSPMTPYRYFENHPSQLLDGVWLKVLEEQRQYLITVAARETGARNKLRALVRGYIEFWQTRPEYYALLHGFDHVPAAELPRSPVGSSDVFSTTVALQRAATEDFAGEIGAPPGNTKLACDIESAMAMGYLHGTLINRRYPWSDHAELLPVYVEGVIHAVEHCLMTGAPASTGRNDAKASRQPRSSRQR